jgi:CTP:molybdopterin cytidylyltransferase MocA
LNHGNSAIVVSQWKDRPGPPVLFPPKFLNELKALSGEEGAQSVWKRHEGEVRFYETGEPFQDVDCPGDLPPK